MDAEKLSISLPADMAQMVRNQVKSGAYASNSEVIRDALRMWQRREKEHAERLHSIRTAINEAAEDPREITAQEMRDHFERRYAEAEKKQRP